MKPQNTESPLQDIVDKMFMRIKQIDVTTKKLSDVIQFAVELRDSLMEDVDTLPEHQWWVDKHKKDFIEIIVRANHKAQTILMPDMNHGDVEERVNKALHNHFIIEDVGKRFV